MTFDASRCIFVGQWNILFSDDTEANSESTSHKYFLQKVKARLLIDIMPTYFLPYFWDQIWLDQEISSDFIIIIFHFITLSITHLCQKVFVYVNKKHNFSWTPVYELYTHKTRLWLLKAEEKRALGALCVKTTKLWISFFCRIRKENWPRGSWRHIRNVV